MAHSLEARSPLLDHEFMELAASIPAEWKLHGFEKKVILRNALAAWFAGVLRSPEDGLRRPVGGLVSHDLRDYVRDVLLDPLMEESRILPPAAKSPALLERHSQRHRRITPTRSGHCWSKSYGTGSSSMAGLKASRSINTRNRVATAVELIAILRLLWRRRLLIGIPA